MTVPARASQMGLYNLELTSEQAELVSLSEQLSREKIAPRAARYDREARFPVEDYADLAEHGLTALNVPRAFGGLEVDPLTYALVLKNIGRANGSTGLTLNMHSTICFFLSRIASDEQKQVYFGEAVGQRKLFASTSSEPGISWRGTVVMDTRAVPVDGGFLVSGTKHFCSLSTDAAYFFTWATPPGRSFADDVLFLAIPADSPGIELLPTWDTMSMRGTASHSLRFTDVFVAAERQVGAPGEILKANIVDRFSLGYCATYLGIAEAAYEYATEYARTKSYAPNPDPISHYPIVQSRTAEANVQLEAANLLLRKTARAVESGDDRERTMALNQCKYFVGELALQVTDQALRIVGGRGILRQYDLERFYRDARTASIMPPSGDRCLDTLGKLIYGLEASMFDA